MVVWKGEKTITRDNFGLLLLKYYLASKAAQLSNPLVIQETVSS
jgi:hypothetical protein